MEVQGEGDVHPPAGQHQDGDHEEGDLDGGPNGDAEGCVQLVLEGEDDGGRDLAGVAHHRQQDGGDKGQREAQLRGSWLYAVYKDVRKEGHDESELQDAHDGAPEAQHRLRLPLLLAGLLLCGRPGILLVRLRHVQLRVADELEVEEGAIDCQKDEAEHPREDGDIQLPLPKLRAGGLQGVGDHQRQHPHHQQPQARVDTIPRKALLVEAHPAGEEGEADGQQEVGEEGAEEGQLHHPEEALLQRLQADHELTDVPHRGVKKPANGGVCVDGQLVCGEAEALCGGAEANEGECKGC
mmetsp:Transcript_25310/g.70779  ORF Transcript_25310/g.70779 Transcript_25310/m.70779 type:complete len:296 (+) Transcript_25310:370-1257(+)